ncbi:MAG: apolipoprotein N-acyltransferase [Bacteroidota bacterium]|nr:apolipoprotein N-acyltransferase [Bacteroidota bacterium]MDX5446762.1 apolipoprotein N-acyltransferase [Bacteroidota bacterium]
MPNKLFLTFLTPFLLWLAWPPMPYPITAFFAFVPLLYLEFLIHADDRRRKGTRVFLFSWLAMGLFNLFTTWWIWNAHWSGVITTVLVNGAMMAVPIWGYHLLRRVLPLKQSLIGIPVFWICFETIHKDWDMSWPWLTLGNVFAKNPEWVQWYSWTGVFGGTLWIWIVNILIFAAGVMWWQNRQFLRSIPRLFAILVLLTLPAIWMSWRWYSNYEENGTPVEVVVVQPNFDAYTEKFSLPENEQVKRFLDLAKKAMTDSTRYVVGPETMLPRGFWEPGNQSPALTLIQRFASENQVTVVAGATSFRQYSDGEKTSTARPLQNGQGYYDVYNTSFQVDPKGQIMTYHKNKLVVGVERMPFESVIKPLLGEVVIDLGGASGTLGSDPTPVNFKNGSGHTVGAPICFESVFGEHLGGFVRKGADLLFVITNDDWWGDTNGKLQHLHYARLRAIENRRDIARSANTGISAFIDQRGDLIDPQSYRTQAAIRHTMHSNEEMTYYTTAGDVIGRVSWFVTAFLGLSAFVRGFLRRREG